MKYFRVSLTIFFLLLKSEVLYSQWPITTDAAHPQGFVFGTSSEYRTPYTNATTIHEVYYPLPTIAF